MTAKRERSLLALGCVLAFFAQVAAFQDVFLDDAYVTFHYGQNLATGRGLVFNPGERIFGASSPGHALLSALIYTFAGERFLPGLMSILGCAAWTAQAALVYLLGRDALGRGVAAIAAIAIAVGASRAQQFVPLETNLVAAGGLAALLLAMGGRAKSSGLAFGLAVVFRPDAALLGLALGPLLVMRVNRRALFFAVLSAVAPVSAWGLFATSYYGSPLPQALGPNVFHDSPGSYAGHVVLELPRAALPFAAPIWVLPLAGAMAVWGVTVVIRRRAHALAALLSWGAIHALWLVIRTDASFHWHLYPSVLAFALALFVGLGELIARLPPPAAIAAGVATALAPAPSTVVFAATQPHASLYGARDGAYRFAAAWLKSSAGPDDAVEAEEIGTMAYFSGLRFYRHPGLYGPDADDASPRAAAHPNVRFSVTTQPAGVGAHLPFYVTLHPVTELKYDRWRIWIADCDEAR